MITYEDFRDKRREYAFTKSVSNNPKDQDAARKIRTQMDYDDLKKQIGSKKKPQLPANAVVESEMVEARDEVAIANRKWLDKRQKKIEQKHKEGKPVKPMRDYGEEVVHEEDKAYKYVLAKLKAKHGDGVLTKGDKMPEPSAAQKKKNAAIRAKRAKEDHRDPTEKASDGRYSDRYSNRGSD